jgi:hypothetical protein
MASIYTVSGSAQVYVLVQVELDFVGETFHSLNVFLILDNAFVFKLIKRIQIRFLRPATVPQPLLNQSEIKELETILP